MVHSIAFANPEDLSRPFVETSRSGFALAQDVSAYSLVAVARAVAPLMASKEEGGGSIMTLTYLGSTRVVQNYNVMGVAKAALEATVRYLANDLGPSNIRVNAISAGPIKTASARGIKGFSKMLEIASIAPLRRNTDPAEVASRVLLSDFTPGCSQLGQNAALLFRAGFLRQTTAFLCKLPKLPRIFHGELTAAFA